MFIYFLFFYHEAHTRLSSYSCNEIFTQSEETLRCYEQCIKLQGKQALVWIEYGSFAYWMHAFCSRNLKQYSDTLSMDRFEFVENKKEECINLAFKCFDTVNRELMAEIGGGSTTSQAAAAATSTFTFIGGDYIDGNQHDERWLHHYMLGKIAEKKKEQPSVFLAHYMQSAKFLFENNATYPIKINHSNPQNLSIEALEIFYRISASIIKYIEQHSVVQRVVGKLFQRVLKELATSPFALNQAKIDDSSINALKRKMNQNNEDGSSIKLVKLDNQTTIIEKVPAPLPPPPTVVVPVTTDKREDTEPMDIDPSSSKPPSTEQLQNSMVAPSVELDSKPSSPNRRGSQESSATTTTTTTTTGSSSSSTSSSTSSDSDSSSSGSDSSDSSSDGPGGSKKRLADDVPFTDSELDAIYRLCIKNFEECVTRFPEHYKSVYRLVNHFMHAPDRLKDFEKCKQLLLVTYTTSLGNTIQGLFVERKTNNFFNGIWRIPSSEIDRPGSFFLSPVQVCHHLDGGAEEEP